MKIAVFGTGMVGHAIATKLVAIENQVMMGSRDEKNEKAVAWASAQGANASAGSYAQAGAFGELVFNCTSGMGSLAALEAAGADTLRGKILVDVSNPLDFSKGMPPTLFVPKDDSLGEQIQRKFPDTRVVKTLNTINCDVMVDPARVPGDHDVFVSGNDAGAKREVEKLLREGFGWKSVVDLGDITAARATESYVLFWVRLFGVFGHANFNIKIVK